MIFCLTKIALICNEEIKLTLPKFGGVIFFDRLKVPNEN